GWRDVGKLGPVAQLGDLALFEVRLGDDLAVDLHEHLLEDLRAERRHEQKRREDPDGRRYDRSTHAIPSRSVFYQCSVQLPAVWAGGSCQRPQEPLDPGEHSALGPRIAFGTAQNLL